MDILLDHSDGDPLLGDLWNRICADAVYLFSVLR